MSLSEKMLGSLGRASCRRPWVILGFALVATIVSIAILPGARFTSDVISLLPDQMEEVRIFREAAGDLEESNLLFVLLSADGPDREKDLRDLAERWERELRDRPEVRRVEYRTDRGVREFLDRVFSRSFAQYLSPDGLEDLVDALSDEEIRRRVESSRATLRTTPGASLRVEYDPLGLWDILAEDLGSSTATYRIDTESGLLLSPDHRHLLIIISGTAPPTDLEYGRALLEVVREAEEAARKPDPDGIEIRYTGGYVYALGEERTIKRDLAVTIITSLIGVHLIFLVAFRRIRSILFVGLPLVLGILWTFAAYILIQGGEIVAGTAAFAAILAGLGIDFAIHMLQRFETETRSGATREEAIRIALVRTGRANLAAALTTSAAFGAFLVCEIPGLASTGLFAGLGILLCLTSMTTVMPALLRLLGSGHREVALPLFGLGALGQWVERRPRTCLLGALGFTAIVVLGGSLRIGNLRFESDARRLRPEGDEAVRTQERIEGIFGGAFSHVLLVVPGADAEEVLRRTEAMEPALQGLVQEEVIASYETVSRLLPSRARQDQARQLLASRLPPDRAGAIRGALGEAGFRPEAFEGTLQRIQEALHAGTPVTADRLREAGMAPYLDRHLRETDRGSLGVIHLYPKVNLWDGPTRTAWIQRVREILPPTGANLTGTVILSQALADLVQEDFLRAAVLALLAIGIIASVHFRRPLPVALSLVPVILGAIWMIAGMAILGIDLNYMNIVIYPMVFGLGVDDGIHLVHRHREDRPAPDILLRGTGRAIFLTSLTTLLGFGSLTLADHRGVASLGQTSLIGIAACLGTSLFILPPLLVLLQRRSR